MDRTKKGMLVVGMISVALVAISQAAIGAGTRTNSESCYSVNWNGYVNEPITGFILESYCKNGLGYKEKKEYVKNPSYKRGWHCVNKGGGIVPDAIDMVSFCRWRETRPGHYNRRVQGACYLFDDSSDSELRFYYPACVFR